MEAFAVLELVLKAYYDRGFIVGSIIDDDDSSMKALLHHSYKECQANKENFLWPQVPSKDGRLGTKLCDTGKLPLAIPEPKWLAHPTHRTKVVAKQYFGVKTK
eukprot:12550262-Ditylum_brightwellii.AAC.1